jgi:voltage-gated potassium channel
MEWLFTGIFTIEYGLRVYSAPNKRKYMLSFMGIIDLLAILPTYLMFIYPPIGGMIAIRVVRLIRVFRVLELSAYLRGAYTMQIALRSSRPKITILGTVMYIVEGQQNGFESIGKSIYWAITTLTTVGYGDIVPHTVIGKIIASFMMILGYAIIAVPTGIVSAEFANQSASRRHRDKIIAKEDQIIAKEDQIMAKEDQIIEQIKKLEQKINDLTK